MVGVVLFTLFYKLTYAIIVHENVAFHKAHEISLTRSKWLSTFVIDTKPYDNFLDILSQDLRNAQIAANSIQNFYDFPSKQDYHKIIKGLNSEISSLQDDRIALVHSYIELHSIHSRMVRSLIPIIGKGLSYLFGTATESDLKTIRVQVDNLAQNQKEMAHVVDESISVINVTRVEMAENRQTINKLIVSLRVLNYKLKNITQDLEREVFQVGQLVQLYLQLDAIIQTARRTIGQANAYMEHLQLQLNMLSLGHLSPSIITPRTLKGLLIEIESHLPPFLELPYDPKGEIWKLYQTLTCTTVLDRGKFLVIVLIPLLDKAKKFEIFDIFNMPVPMSNPHISEKQLPSMVARYHLEADSIAINLEEMKYALLSKVEKEHCSSPLHHYCDIKSPIYSIVASKLCIIAIFMKDEEKIRESCHTIVEPNSVLPQASHIVDGFWFVATKKHITFAVVCPEEEKISLQVDPPMHVIKLNMSCHATSDYLTLLPYYHKESKSDVSDQFINKLQSYDGSKFKIWEPFFKNQPYFTKTDIPPELKDINRNSYETLAYDG